MNDPKPTLHDFSSGADVLRFSANPKWPQFPATLERLKAHPIAPAPKPTPKIDLELHDNYLEIP